MPSTDGVDTLAIRRVQSLIVLLSCLPPGGKCAEVLGMALSLPADGPLSRLGPPRDATPAAGLREWLESLWARADLSPDERRIVEWQNTATNMEVAIRELEAVEDRIHGVWALSFDGVDDRS